MRKKIFRILGCTVLAAMLLTSCKDEESLVNNEIPVEKGKLSFVLPLGGKKAVTYGTVVGEAAEYSIKRMRIFWFKDGGTGASSDMLFKIFNYGVSGAEETITLGTGTPLDSVNNSTIATINVGDNDQPSKFYIIANVNGSSSVQSDALLNVVVGVTTRADFEDMVVSNELQAISGTIQDEMEHITTPLPMSVIDDATDSPGGYISVLDPANQGVVSNVHLKRRVARFDVINTADYSNFEITSIRVTKAQKVGWLHDEGFLGTESWIKTGNLYVDGSIANGPRSAKQDADEDGIYDDFQNGANSLDSVALTKAVFYLWPTKLTDDASGTEIILEGKYYGQYPRLYKLTLPAGGVDIQANMLYKIKVYRSEDAQLRFKLIVDHWDDTDDPITASNAGEDLTNWGTFQSGSTTFNLGTDTDMSLEYASSLKDSVKITIINEGTNLTADSAYNHVTRLAFIAQGTGYLASDLAATKASRVKSTTVLTYGTHYTTTHEIWLPPTDAPITTTLQILNAANPQEMKFVTLKSNNYAKTGIPPVRIGDLLWAPVNVGATSLPATKASFNNDSTGLTITGNHYQWGRNTPFPPNVTPTFATTTFATVVDANASNAFVKISGADWLATADNDLWSGDNAQGPCPPGWRVPTADEFQTLVDSTAKSTVSYYHAFTLKNPPTRVVYFPLSGRRDATTGSIVVFGNASSATCVAWTSTATSTTPSRFASVNGTPMATAENKVNGLSVRAVRVVP